ncbi:hypothetical protein nbrc107696_26280 [Gordonia spumicola]|uniref:Low molecular weight antigen MTB12-like C-terminal domain-containing protein n=1 Tax=Gordonia spumicola TaxID=589161 RepID=A0A7I9VAB7_9ACTN|nr:hypothetical protein [Gordonia spumicola]GEE02182.1 hypothetical protein nbrc107696_26280 [Gordonia spumicola]
MSIDDQNHELYDGDAYPDSPAPEKTSGGSRVSLPTVMVSAGIAAVVSALIVTIGVVGLATSDRFTNAGSAPQTPTVVNLGAAQTPGVTNNNGSAVVGAPQTTPGVVAPVGEQVPESNGGDTNGGGTTTLTTQAPGQQQQQPGQPQPQVQATALTPGQLTTKIKLIMNTRASRAARADELEGGTQALVTVDQVAQLLSLNSAGFSYKMIGPVQVNGSTMSATLQMSLVGSGSRTKTLSWVWSGTKWKLTNGSVCDIASYAQLKCSVA